MLALLALLGAAAWLVPEKLWFVPARLSASAIIGLFFRRTRRRLKRLRAVLPSEGLNLSPRAIESSIMAGFMCQYLEYLRAYRPGGWHPEIDLRGRRHLQEAQAAGRGVVLWVAPFMHTDLVAKMALYREGAGLTHLSSVNHGTSRTHFGVRWLNPIKLRVEDRCLAERVMMTEHNRMACMRTLAKRLSNNKVVSIVAGSDGVRALKRPFCAGSIQLATGPASLALAAGAALLPLFTIYRGPGRFDVRVEAPLVAPAGLDRSGRVEALVTQYAERLEDQARRQPCQFYAWQSIESTL